MSTIPRGMVPITALAHAVEVVTGPEMAMDGDKPKKKAAYPGRTGWRLTIEATVGFRQKRVLGANNEVKVFNGADLFSHSVTVWADQKPQCAPGDFIFLENLAVGRLDNGFYLTATNAKKVDVKAESEEKK